MLKVTPSAVEELRGMLDGTERAAGEGLRLLEHDGELALRLDSPQEGDQVVSSDEGPVLMIDEELSGALEGATLDAVEGAQGRTLRLIAEPRPSPDGMV